MVQLSVLALAFAAAGSVSAAPSLYQKRIAQVISDSTTQWEQACDTAGGAGQCNTIAVNAFGTLLAAAGPCDQQNNADTMMDLSKKLNSADMIKFAQIFAQQPRNSPSSDSVQYCDTAPRNAELNGLFQCQFQSTNPTTFVGGVQVGGPNTIPFGLKSPVSPPGSCPAHPQGPIADGTQLVDQVSSSGAPDSGSASSSSNTTASSSSDSSSTVDASTSTDAPATSTAAAAPAASSASSGSPDSSSASGSSSSSSSSGFQLQNGQEAQALNKQFQSFTSSSSCTTGQDACINGQFAQCSNGQFVMTACAGGLTCAALPLVNKPGTSVTCTTAADAASRIANTGATGGITGDGNDSSATNSAAAPAASATPGASSNSSSSGSSFNTSSSGSTASGNPSFALQNGKDAQALNAQFAGLTADSSCTDGQQACVTSQFAQCVGGKFELTACGAGTQCAALPLVNKPGTSVTCATAADVASRIANTGATGGVTGNN